MSLIQYIGFISVLAVILLHLFIILRRLSSIEKFMSTNPKFVYEVRIENSQEGIRTINSNGLSFPQYYKSNKISSLQDLFYQEHNNSINNDDIHKLIEEKKEGELETKNRMERNEKIIIPIFRKVQTEIEEKGKHKSKREILDSIFQYSDGEVLNLKDIAYIFILLKHLNLMNLSNYDKQLSYTLKSSPFMRRLGSYVNWYLNHSNKIMYAGKSSWKVKI